MVNTVKLGSINFPKLMRQVGYRTNQVRDLVFARDAIFQKTVGNKKDADGSSGDGTGRSDAMAGPDVSFGYEGRLSTALAGTAANTAYHVSSPELILPGLKALQTPIMSRSGNLERTGHRITGACTFYMPSMGYIKALDNFSETTQFSEIETFDKLIDIERIIENPNSATYSGSASNWSQGLFTATQPATTFSFPDTTPAYELDRIQFKIKISSGSANLSSIELTGDEDASRSLKWSGTAALSTSAWLTVDLPVRDIAVGDTTLVYKDGEKITFTASTTNTILNLDKLYGASSYDLTSLIITISSGIVPVEIKDIYLYKEAEWRVESIKDYRDEYMEVAAVRVRGDRTSRRRAYG